MRRRVLRTIAACLLAAAGLSGCSAPAATVPEGVTADILQRRTDIADGLLAISITNGSDAPVTFTRASYTSPRFTDPMVWDEGSRTLGVGRTLDLRIVPTELSCDGAEGPGSVTIDLVDDEGRTGSLDVTPGDPFDLFPRFADEGCASDALARIATVHLATVDGDGQPGHPADVVIEVTPTGAAGTASLDGIRATPLIAMSDDGEAAESAAIGVEISGTDAPSTVWVPIVPVRCDAHGLADDKVGANLPLDVTVDGTSIRLVPTVDDAFRSAIHTFVTDYCGT
ncbi:hypothetical protein [Homoserinibacter sp. GY 40078]|uniref:hypothetical protein n=1 Tax=Homoserinibacter sp. GY 40078 TaxID=2603275 RepID=UPI0011CA6A86|nr:hypothetical protein [Homoserinibacter sp. GY 40078]TXK17220.1 hypothetical protein FVQ89_10195 [Homoserinibacter sp. GY 40078]